MLSKYRFTDEFSPEHIPLNGLPNGWGRQYEVGPMFLLVANLLMGCEAPQPYYYRGMNLLDVEFVFADVEHGTYPNTGILNHPTNPIDQALFDGKWDVEAFGYAPASYYVWATQLAVEATGDNQFYTAQALTSIYMLEMMDEYERYHVWQMAVNAHNALLEHFPDAVSYLADGETYFPLWHHYRMRLW